MKRTIFNDTVFMRAILIFTFAAITVCYIVLTPDPTSPKKLLRVIPLCVSLIIGLLQSYANRYYLLIGSLNSILYSIVYYLLDLRSMALYALIFSFPLQLITFFRWNKRAYGNSTVLRKLGIKKLIMVAIASASAWAILYLIFYKLGSPYLILDNTVTIIGMITTLLTLMSYIDAVYFQIITSVISIILYIQMIMKNPEQTTFLIYSIYSLFCVIRSMRAMLSIYKKQKESGITYNKAAKNKNVSDK